MPVVDTAHQRMVTARSIHQEQKLAGTHKWDIIDWSALIAGSRVAAGMDPFDCNKVRRHLIINGRLISQELFHPLIRIHMLSQTTDDVNHVNLISTHSKL